MRFLSLFSGIEAASQAWKPLGWECVGVSEIEAFPCAALAQIHPDVPNLGDITKITELDVFTLGQIDLVVFGSPCQDLSVAGKRKGLDGARSGLFHDAMRVIGWARKHGGCRFALWENVPGAFSSNGGDDFGVVVGQMAGLDCPTPPKGWGTEGATLGTEAMVEWSVLDAQWFGVAQRRRRVFALADFGDWSNRPPILLEPQGLRGDTAPSREAGQGVASTIRAGAANGGAGHGARSGDSKDELITVHTATCGGIGDYSSSSRSNAIRASGADLGRGCEVLVSGELRRPVRVTEPVICAATGQAGAEITTGFSCSLTCAHETPYVAYTEGVLPFDTTQISSPANYSCPKAGDPCHPLSAQAHAPSIAYAIQVSGACAKQVVTATLVTPEGKRFVATNHCMTPQATCPRAGMPTGEGYELCKSVCGQVGHAETNVINFAGKEANGAALYVEGHTYICESCRATAKSAGVSSFEIGTPPANLPTVAYAIQGSMVGRSDNAGPQGDGINAEVCFTQSTTDRHAVAYGIPGNWIGRTPENGGNAVEPMHNVAPCLTKTDRHGVCAPIAYAFDALASNSMKSSNPNSGCNVVQVTAWSKELTASVDVSGTMVKGGEGGRHAGVMLPNMQVRRLTPRECERLQGFPDDHTLITVKGKPAADGPRYKALGNSMAVPVMHWIGKRIDIVNNFF